MTCIAAIVESGSVWMAGDRAASSNDQISYRATPKVFRCGPFLVGGGGGQRAIEILRHVPPPPAPPAGLAALDRFMGLRFAAWARRAHEKHGHARERDNASETESLLLIGVAGRLYAMEGSYTVTRADDFEAVGSGADLAAGALYATQGLGWTPRERLLVALAAAERFNAYVRGPFDVLELSASVMLAATTQKAWATTYKNAQRKRA